VCVLVRVSAVTSAGDCNIGVGLACEVPCASVCHAIAILEETYKTAIHSVMLPVPVFLYQEEMVPGALGYFGCNP
jgi:hypothetical protein